MERDGERKTERGREGERRKVREREIVPERVVGEGNANGPGVLLLLGSNVGSLGFTLY